MNERWHVHLLRFHDGVGLIFKTVDVFVTGVPNVNSKAFHNLLPREGCDHPKALVRLLRDSNPAGKDGCHVFLGAGIEVMAVNMEGWQSSGTYTADRTNGTRPSTRALVECCKISQAA
eukprot:scaffold354228_cov45-Prasinocladus_malaysianus.AAC.1